MSTKIYVNGIFYTLDAEQPNAEAVVVQNETFIDMGTTSDMLLQWGRNGAQVIDLQGKTVTPGLIDSHLHISAIAVGMLSLDLTEVRSKQELLEKVQEKAQSTASGEWIVGRGWDENSFQDGVIPTIEELDWAAPHCPIFLTRICGHAFLVNSKALEVSGYSSSLSVPGGGTIVLDERTKKPTGLLLETASQIITRNIPEAGYWELKYAVKQAMELAMRCGLTSVHTEDLRYLGGLDQTYKIYNELINEEEMRLRTNLLIYYPYMKNLKERGMFAGYGNDKMQIGAVKIFADGALGRRTAYLSEPYHDAPHQLGELVHTQEEMHEIVREARSLAMPIAVHTIGDKALEIVLDVLDKFPPVSFRDRLIHVQVMHPELFARLRSPHRIVDIQPRFVVGDFPWVINRLGEVRVEHSYAWKSLLDCGVACAGGSDAPVEPIHPLLGIHAAVTRKAPYEEHEGWNRKEKLSILQALQLFTCGGAYATNEENRKGTISRGKWADMTVFSNDVFTIPADELLSTEIEMTVIGGEICYERGRQ